MPIIESSLIGYEPFLSIVNELLKRNSSPSKQDTIQYCKVILKRLNNGNRKVFRWIHFKDLWKSLEKLVPQPKCLIRHYAEDLGIDTGLFENVVLEGYKNMNPLPDEYKEFLCKITERTISRLEIEIETEKRQTKQLKAH